MLETKRREWKALSGAQPVKREIDETLLQVELEKRRLIGLEREEAHLRTVSARKKQELAALRQAEAERKVKAQLTARNEAVSNHLAKTLQESLAEVAALRQAVDVHRRQIGKYHELNARLREDAQQCEQEAVALGQAAADTYACHAASPPTSSSRSSSSTSAS